jgi:hypothetical protein
MIRPVLLAISLSLTAAFVTTPGPSAFKGGHVKGTCITRRPALHEARHTPSFLRMSADPAAVKALVEKANAATGSEAAPTRVAKALKKPTGAITISVEYADAAGVGTENGVEFRTLSAVMRRDGCTSIFVDVSTDRGMNDCENLFKEQVSSSCLHYSVVYCSATPFANIMCLTSCLLSFITYIRKFRVFDPCCTQCKSVTVRFDHEFVHIVAKSMAKGKFPGPLPIIATGKIDSIEVAAKAKAVGADAVYLPASSGMLVLYVDVCWCGMLVAQ